MRAPDTKEPLDAADEFDASRLYGTFTPSQWQDIKADWAAVGIDLDTAMLPPMDDKPWWLPDFTLRDAIQHIAHRYGALMRLQRKPRTPLQRAKERQATLDALATALTLTLCTDLIDDDHTWWTDANQLRARIERRHVLNDAITKESVDLKERIAALKAKGSARAANSKTLRNDYLREQARVWLAFKPNVSSRDRRAHLRRYLVHCSALLFAEPKIESKVRAFVDHLLSSKRRPK
jgi:hypothetical protein